MGLLFPLLATGVPNGTWLSQPQIRFHASTNTLDRVMKDIQTQKYQVVFLDFRGVPDAVRQQVSQTAREQGLRPVVWVQSPQYRALSIAQLIDEARYGDGIQVDDHFFANYTQRDFQYLRAQYKNPIFCSIQPFQASSVPASGCNQLDVQCYTSKSFSGCQKLADGLNAVLSLSEKDTFRLREQLGVRRFNVFLWPYSNRKWETSSQEESQSGALVSRSFSVFQLPKVNNR